MDNFLNQPKPRSKTISKVVCSRLSYSGVRREVREREKNKEEDNPLPHPLAVFLAQISFLRPHNLSAQNRLLVKLLVWLE